MCEWVVAARLDNKQRGTVYKTKPPSVVVQPTQTKIQPMWKEILP